MGVSSLSEKTRQLLAKSFEPTDDVIIVLKDDDNVSAGGIVMATESDKGARDRICRRAFVLSTGPGHLMEHLTPGTRQTMPCKNGDWVIIAAFSGLALGEEARKVLGTDLKGSEILLIRSHDVLAVCNAS